jgi:hypothetical protein
LRVECLRHSMRLPINEERPATFGGPLSFVLRSALSKGGTGVIETPELLLLSCTQNPVRWSILDADYLLYPRFVSR